MHTQIHQRLSGAVLIALAVAVLLLTSCSKETNSYELLNAGSGLVYRINKKTGEVTLVAGTEIRKLQEWTVPKAEEPKKNYLMSWPAVTNSQLGDITLKLKTNWREGKMYYIFEASPYAGHLETEHNKGSQSSARFNLYFFDAEGFQAISFPIQLSDMTRTVDASGKPTALSVNMTISCSAESYEASKYWSLGWGGF